MLTAITKPVEIISPPVAAYQHFRSADTGTVSFRSQLDAMLTAENANGYVFQATPHSHGRANAYLKATAAIMGRAFPLPEFISDGEGGIDIEWVNEQRRVAISCRASADQRDCVYWREIGLGGYEARDVTLLRIIERLRWLSRA